MKQIIMATASGEEHGCLGLIANSEKDDGFKHMSPENKAKAEKLRKEESRIIEAQYIHRKEDNGRLEMSYCRWGGDAISKWKFINNHTYKVPVGLVNQVNNCSINCRSTDDTERTDINKIRSKDRVHQFIAVGF